MNAYENYEIEEVEEMEEEKTSFKITDLDTANWALRKIAALNKKIAENEALAEREHNRIDLWQQKSTEANKQSILFFEGMLKSYFAEEKAKDAKFKLSTPYGSVISRKQQPKWDYEDTAIRALEELGLSDLIKTEITKSLKKTEIKKALKVVNGKAVTEDGEVVEGITIIPQEDNITVKTAKG